MFRRVDHQWGSLVTSAAAQASQKKTGDKIDPPDRLFHYTDAGGLLGIVSSATLWATDLEYMNDDSELQYGMQLAGQIALEEFVKMRIPENSAGYRYLRAIQLTSEDLFLQTRGKVFEAVTTGLKNHFLIGAACFCLDGDILGQWRGYGGPGGYSIGFDGHGVREANKANSRAFLSPIEYDPSEQDSTLRESIGAHLSTLDPKTTLPETVAHIVDTSILSGIVLSAAQFKDPAFREEREWRLITFEEMDTKDSRVKFRSSGQGIVPYIPISLANSSGLLPIRSVTVGPGADRERRIRAVRALLSSSGYSLNDIEVISSNVPFRDI